MTDDQAAMLRKRVDSFRHPSKNHKTIAVVSGKGGVGKSNFSLNFSLSLHRKGYSVLLIDMDIGMGNVDILMGTQPNFTIVDFFTKNASIDQIIYSREEAVDFIAGGSGLNSFVDMKESQLERFFNEFSTVLSRYDYVLFDMGAGINSDALKFILSVDEVIVVTTPEPTSIMDAYAAMKFIHLHKRDLPFFLIVNRTFSNLEGKETFHKLQKVLARFLERDLISLGSIPDDSNVTKAVRSQVPLINFNENAISAKALFEITDRYCKQQFDDLPNKKSDFLGRLKRFLFER